MLVIKLSSGSQILPGQSIALSPGLKSQDGLSDPSEAITVTVVTPSVLELPAFTLTGPSQASSCDMVTIEAVGDSPRPLVYEWVLQSGGTNNLTKVLASWTLSSITFSASLLNETEPTVISAVATNFLGSISVVRSRWRRPGHPSCPCYFPRPRIWPRKFSSRPQL